MILLASFLSAAMLGPPLPVLRAAAVPVACLSSEEIHGAITAHEAIPPMQAHRHARDAAPGEILRIRLCREEGILLYQVTVLKRDGHVARVTIDASSGKVSGIR